MNKQPRFLIADAGDALAGTLADALSQRGVWVTLRPQTRQSVTNAVRREHPDFLILNAMYPTIDFITIIENIRRITDIHIIALFRDTGQFMEKLLQSRSVYCWRAPRTSDEIIDAICKKFLSDYLADLDKLGNELKKPKYCLETDIENLLHLCGIPREYAGFTYLLYAIRLVVLEPEKMSSVYNDCINKFKISYGALERDMRAAIETAWKAYQKQTGSIVAYSWLRLPFVCEKRPSNLKFISAAADIRYYNSYGRSRKTVC